MDSHTSAFFAVADRRHFLGLVALINSLRLVGHDEPIYVTDQGLSPEQKKRLAGQVTIVEAGRSAAPHLAKFGTPLRYPTDVRVLVDADIIVLRHLGPLIDSARAGGLVAFADQVQNRFDPRWSQLLGLGTLDPQTYINAGLVAVGGAEGQRFLQRVEAGCRRVDLASTVISGAGSEQPFYYLDQDVVNAILGASPPVLLSALPHDLAPFPPFQGVEVEEPETLRCVAKDGQVPFLLHHVRKKPWLARTPWNAYCALFARLLLGPGVAISVAPAEVPRRFRSGFLARSDQTWSTAVGSAAALRGRLGVRRAWQRRHRRPRPAVESAPD